MFSLHFFQFLKTYNSVNYQVNRAFPNEKSIFISNNKLIELVSLKFQVWK